MLLSLRTLAAVVALVALLVVVRAMIPDDAATADGSTPGVMHHRIDLVVPIARSVPAFGFSIGADGITTADMSLVLDAQRTMFIAAGTPGESSCATSTDCVVAVDLLGDAVVWFSIVDGGSGKELVLPATVELLEDGHVVLANGWEVSHARKVVRNCGEETPSLTAFIDRFGDTSTTTFDLEAQEVVEVTCPV